MGIVYLQTLARSFIYTKNDKGPKMDPWGTPHLKSCIMRAFETYNAFPSPHEIHIS